MPDRRSDANTILSKLSKRRQIYILYPHFEEVRGGVGRWLMARWKARVKFLLSVIELLFTAHRNIASAVLATAIPSICLSVRLSITRRFYAASNFLKMGKK